jgi:hypothetical protein
MWTTPNYQVVFRRLLPRLGYQSAIWAVAHRLCRTVRKILHEGVRFIEQSVEPDPKAKKKRALRCWREPFASLGTKSQSHP